MKITRKNRRIISTISVLALVILALFAFDVRLKTVHYTIRSEKMSGRVRLLLVTDLHSCHYGEGEGVLLDAIDRQKPDVVLLGGDIFDDGLPHRNTQMVLHALAQKYPCYYVTGNHEYWSNDIINIVNIVRNQNVIILDGTFDTLTIRGQKINICGIDDPEVNRYQPAKPHFDEQLRTASAATQNGHFTVLLSHRPEHINHYAQYPFDLVLAGHAHGGQWRIPHLLNGVCAPDQGFLPRYTGGLYHYSGQKMIVSRGLARESTRIPRIFNRPELAIIDIIPK